jgi:hypothetical protein
MPLRRLPVDDEDAARQAAGSAVVDARFFVDEEANIS